MRYILIHNIETKVMTCVGRMVAFIQEVREQSERLSKIDDLTASV